MKGKKASAAFITLVVFFGIIALGACWLFLAQKSQGQERRLGETEFMLLRSYQFGEDFMTYLDQAGKYSLDHALISLASKGGVSENPWCGSFNGYTLWNSAGRDCFPTRDFVKDSLSKTFTFTLNEYLLVFLPKEELLSYSLDFINEDSLTIRAIPENRLEFIIGKTGKDEKIHPGIMEIRAGEVVDKTALTTKLQQSNQPQPAAETPSIKEVKA